MGTAKPQTPRVPLIDVARGIALIAMTIYHFAWDLEYFGYLLPATINASGWIIFARIIASSFLLLAGVSLVLAHGNSIQWHGFWKREALVLLAAALITIATYFMFPTHYIFFGILHAIALFSLFGLAFLRLPWWVTALVALAVVTLDRSISGTFFDANWLLWLGLSSTLPLSNDYVPLFPWFAATLAGIAVAKLGVQKEWWSRLAALNLPMSIQRPLRFIGNHSLIYYLIHQPLLIALLWAFTAVAGPPEKSEAFLHICNQQCSITESKEFCGQYCQCIVEGLAEVNLVNKFLDGRLTSTDGYLVDGVKDQCVKKYRQN